MDVDSPGPTGNSAKLPLGNFDSMPRPEDKKISSQPRFNSTSSIFISSTITTPDIEEIIFCVALVIHYRVEQARADPAGAHATHARQQHHSNTKAPQPRARGRLVRLRRQTRRVRGEA